MKLDQKVGDKLKCLLCPHECLLSDWEYGKCGVRQGSPRGIELPLCGIVSCMAVEPIEKKPFKEFMPGTKTLSVGMFGCNLNCICCENYSVSQVSTPIAVQAEDIFFAPELIIDKALLKSCSSICMTYSEPTVHYEYLIDLGEVCRKFNLPFILKTNGYINEEPWSNICDVIDAVNIDWKGTHKTFKEITGCKVNHIFDIIRKAVDHDVHVEISIPIYHGIERDLEFTLFGRFVSRIKKDIPCHLLKITPTNNMEDLSPTTDGEILHAEEILSSYLSNIYA